MITAVLLLLATLGAVARADDACDLRLAEVLLNPPATVRRDVDEISYTPLTRYRFLELATSHRRMSLDQRPPRGADPAEFIFHLGLVERGVDRLWTRTNLVVRFAENDVLFDRRTGEIGRGSEGVGVIKALGVRFRFQLVNHLFEPPYLRVLHAEIIPQINVEIEMLNERAHALFQRPLLSKLTQHYPGEYEAEVPADLKPTELASLISWLGRMPGSLQTSPL